MDIIYSNDGRVHSLKELMESYIVEIVDPATREVKEYLEQWFEHPNMESIAKGIVNLLKNKERT